MMSFSQLLTVPNPVTVAGPSGFRLSPEGRTLCILPYANNPDSHRTASIAALESLDTGAVGRRGSPYS